MIMLYFDMKKFLGIIFGPNGSGKGTLAESLSNELGYYHFDNGLCLREWAKKNNRIEIMNIIDNGELVDDDIVDRSIKDNFEEIGHHKKILLDGIPRKLSQVALIKNLCEKFNFIPIWIIVLNAPVEVLIERLKERVVAPDGKNYHMTLNPPPRHFKLSQLKFRPDDKPEIICKRYEYYVTSTLECLSDTFFSKSKIHTIDATKPIPNVLKEGIDFVKEVESIFTK